MPAWKFTHDKRWTIIDAEAWFDARAQAMIDLQCGPGQLTEEPAEERDAHKVLRWHGSDYAGVRQLVVTEKT